jgi:putative ABC transport system ATP-binding protein
VNTTATTLSPPVLAARDIRKSYGKGTARFDALAGVSLSVYAGESIAIVGKSGSGKSTLMHLLALLDQPDDGTLMVGNTNADELSVRQLNRLRNQDFGFVFQQFFLTPNATVLDNVVLPLKIAGVGARERKTRGMAVLEQLEMADKAKKTRQSPSQADKTTSRHRPRPGEQPEGHLRRRTHRQPRHDHRCPGCRVRTAGNPIRTVAPVKGAET